jgi:hypothetical protein
VDIAVAEMVVVVQVTAAESGPADGDLEFIGGEGWNDNLFLCIG